MGTRFRILPLPVVDVEKSEKKPVENQQKYQAGNVEEEPIGKRNCIPEDWRLENWISEKKATHSLRNPLRTKLVEVPVSVPVPPMLAA